MPFNNRIQETSPRHSPKVLCYGEYRSSTSVAEFGILPDVCALRLWQNSTDASLHSNKVPIPVAVSQRNIPQPGRQISHFLSRGRIEYTKGSCFVIRPLDKEFQLILARQQGRTKLQCPPSPCYVLIQSEMSVEWTEKTAEAWKVARLLTSETATGDHVPW